MIAGGEEGHSLVTVEGEEGHSLVVLEGGGRAEGARGGAPAAFSRYSHRTPPDVPAAGQGGAL